MLKITYAGYIGLSPAIPLQFTVEMCAAAKNCKIFNKTPLLGVQGRSSSSMFTNLKSPSPVLVMICSKSVSTCNRFHTIKANSNQMTSFRGAPLFDALVRGKPTSTKFCHDKRKSLGSLQRRCRDPSLRHFDTKPQCDGRTDGQTDGRLSDG